MKPVPKLLNDFILNESEYQSCQTWLAEAWLIECLIHCAFAGALASTP